MRELYRRRDFKAVLCYNSLMEEKLHFSDALNHLEALVPQAAEYMRLFVDMIHEFEDAYRERPENVLKCFPHGLEDDQNEMIVLLIRGIEGDGVVKSDVQTALQLLADGLANLPVTLWALQPVFEYFSVRIHSLEESSSRPHRQKIVVPNLLFANHEMARFFGACGFVERRDAGKGSHAKWFDSSGRYVAILALSSKLWLKNAIRQLLQNGVSIEVIVLACRELKIDFQLLEK